MTDIRPNMDRLITRLEDLAQFGITDEGGVNRLALSDADQAARDQLCAWMRDARLTVNIDRIGNIIGVLDGETNTGPIMTGSHIDSVSHGGKLDGTLGVIAGLEILTCLSEVGFTPKHPMAVAAFTNEEGSRFHPDMLGSLVYAGGMEVEEALEIEDKDGITIERELKRIGYDGTLEPGQIKPSAFIELHIEQGPILENEQISLGVVENLQGISWTEIRFHGQANHAGTTPMALRHDAGLCAAKTAVFIRQIAEKIGGGQVATVGEISFHPDVINVVPSRARLTADLRHTDNNQLRLAEELLEQEVLRIAEAEGVRVETKRLVHFEPVLFDKGLVNLIEQCAQASQQTHRRMTSGAGHDAQMMSRIAPAAMIFVPSIKGISHNPAEATDRADIENGVMLLKDVLLTLANPPS